MITVSNWKCIRVMIRRLLRWFLGEWCFSSVAGSVVVICNFIIIIIITTTTTTTTTILTKIVQKLTGDQ